MSTLQPEILQVTPSEWVRANTTPRSLANEANRRVDAMLAYLDRLHSEGVLHVSSMRDMQGDLPTAQRMLSELYTAVGLRDGTLQELLDEVRRLAASSKHGP